MGRSHDSSSSFIAAASAPASFKGKRARSSSISSPPSDLPLSSIITGPSRKNSTSSNELHKRAQDESEREEKISRALTRVEEGLSYRQAAKEIGISFGTVYGRFRGRKSRVKAQEARMKLSFLEETIIEKMLLTTVYIGEPYTQPFFVQAANFFLQAQGDSDPEKVTRQWYRHFRRRHPSMDARNYEVLHNPPNTHYTAEAVESWFKKFEEVYWANKILLRNTYCIDELGFCRGPAFSPASTSCQNRDLNPFKSSAATTERRASHNETDVNIDPPPADSCTFIETICADGTILAPFTVVSHSIYRESQEFLENQPEASDSADSFSHANWVLRSTPSGWLNMDVIMDWLENHFDKATRDKANGEYRLVVLDTHAVHFSTHLLQFGIKNKIIFLFTPSLAMDNLHPFNNAALETLKSDIYTRPAHAPTPDKTFRPSAGEFLSLINENRRRVFTPDIIQKLWKDSGLVPFDSAVIVLDHADRPPSPAPTTTFSASAPKSKPVPVPPAAPATPPIVTQGSVLHVTFLPVKDLDVDTHLPYRSAHIPHTSQFDQEHGRYGSSQATDAVGADSGPSGSTHNFSSFSSFSSINKPDTKAYYSSHQTPHPAPPLDDPKSVPAPAVANHHRSTSSSGTTSILDAATPPSFAQTQSSPYSGYRPLPSLVFSHVAVPDSADCAEMARLAADTAKKNRQLNDMHISYNAYMGSMLKRVYSSISDLSAFDNDAEPTDRKRQKTWDEQTRRDRINECMRELKSAMVLPDHEIAQLKAASSANARVETACVQAQARAQAAKERDEQQRQLSRTNMTQINSILNSASQPSSTAAGPGRSSPQHPYSTQQSPPYVNASTVPPPFYSAPTAPSSYQGSRFTPLASAHSLSHREGNGFDSRSASPPPPQQPPHTFLPPIKNGGENKHRLLQPILPPLSSGAASDSSRLPLPFPQYPYNRHEGPQQQQQYLPPPFPTPQQRYGPLPSLHSPHAVQPQGYSVEQQPPSSYGPPPQHYGQQQSDYPEAHSTRQYGNMHRTP